MEFKKLSDVEVVESVSNAANVLIEENGVIKKAPKTQVGGAGGGDKCVNITSTAEIGQTIIVKNVDVEGNPIEWECVDFIKDEEPDLIMSVYNSSSSSAITSSSFRIDFGNVDNVIAAINENRKPNVKLRWRDSSRLFEEYEPMIYTFNDGLCFKCITTPTNGSTAIYVHTVYLNGDGTLKSANFGHLEYTAKS